MIHVPSPLKVLTYSKDTSFLRHGGLAALVQETGKTGALRSPVQILQLHLGIEGEAWRAQLTKFSH